MPAPEKWCITKVTHCIKVGCKGVFITRNCFRDVNEIPSIIILLFNQIIENHEDWQKNNGIYFQDLVQCKAIIMDADHIGRRLLSLIITKDFFIQLLICSPLNHYSNTNKMHDINIMH